MYDNTIAQAISKKYNQTPLTEFDKITPSTKLDDLNLNWREKDLPERERTKHVHRLHPYLGKFIPQLVEIFLRKYRPHLVYDPFCGSGTTLVEANALVIDSVGVDISAFNVLLSKVKTDEYDLKLMEGELLDILKRSHELRLKSPSTFSDGGNDYIKTWFSKNAQKDLLSYLHLIKDYTYQDLLKIVLSRSARSARLVTHFDLDFPKKPQTAPYYCYKHSQTCQPVNEAYKFIYRYTIDTISRIKEFSKIRTKTSTVAYHADSREIKLPKGIDMVFTSPPYVGLIDYHEQHRYSYEFLRLKNSELEEIGAAKKGQSEYAQKEYIRGINDVLLHTRDFLSKDGLIVIVISDKCSLYKPEAVGCKLVGRVERHVNRRTGRRDSAFYESILIWKKA